MRTELCGRTENCKGKQDNCTRNQELFESKALWDEFELGMVKDTGGFVGENGGF